MSSNPQAADVWIPVPYASRKSKRTSLYFWNDPQGEIITLRDELGIVELPIHQLPGKLLTYAMMRGLIRMMRDSGQPRVTWQAWINGKMPQIQAKTKQRMKPRPKSKPPKPPRPLTKPQQAIILALLDKPNCTATPAKVETFVRTLTRGERVLWAREPDVLMHRRRMANTPALRLGFLIDRLNATK